MAKLCPLFSGSSGNSYYLEASGSGILIDCGRSAKQLENALRDNNIDVGSIRAIFITHEHSDHIQSIDKFSEFTNVYTSDKTLKCILNRNKKIVKVGDVLNFMYGFDIGDLHINPFNISHDAVDPVGYSITYENAKVSISTDSGVVTKGMLDAIRDSNILLLEANHDIDMLRKGTYPAWLKQRILGTRGHICNEVSLNVSCNIKSTNGNLQQLILGHISKENNTAELAYNTVYNGLCKKELLGDTNVSVATQDCSTQLFEIL